MATAALAPVDLPAQRATAPDSVGEAVRLRDAGDFAAAVAVLRTYLDRHPEDGTVARLLAQTLYWSKDFAAARNAYESALARYPGDLEIRRQYGRMLVETRGWARARDVLTPLRDVETMRADAEALLGRLDYWAGDYSSARRHFIAALTTDPGHADARRELREITALTAPWVHLSFTLEHDDQPLDRGGIGVEAGWFQTPLWSVAARVVPAQYRTTDASYGVTRAGIIVAGYSPRLRLDTEVAGGVLQRSGGRAVDWTGRAALRLRLPGRFTIAGSAERAPYLHTTSSLDTTVVTETLTGTVGWRHGRGWLGEIAYLRQWYPDDNSTAMTYAWLLAPLARGGRGELQAGYAFAHQDAAEGRFVLVSSRPMRTRDSAGAPGYHADGRYEPYYTPNNLVSHSVIGAARFGPVEGITVRLNGSYAFYARDDAPFFFVGAAGTPPPTIAAWRGTYVRSSSPWKARVAAERQFGPSLAVTAGFEHSATTFYAASVLDVRLTYRFTAAALRRVDRI